MRKLLFDTFINWEKIADIFFKIMIILSIFLWLTVCIFSFLEFKDIFNSVIDSGLLTVIFAITTAILTAIIVVSLILIVVVGLCLLLVKLYFSVRDSQWYLKQERRYFDNKYNVELKNSTK